MRYVAPASRMARNSGPDAARATASPALVATVQIACPPATPNAVQVRMSFAAFTLKKHWVSGHVVLARRRESPRFTKIWVASPRNQVHEFKLEAASDVDEEVVDWLREAYAVGRQDHLATRGG